MLQRARGKGIGDKTPYQDAAKQPILIRGDTENCHSEFCTFDVRLFYTITSLMLVMFDV